jgi:hypothetical protein
MCLLFWRSFYSCRFARSHEFSDVGLLVLELLHISNRRTTVLNGKISHPWESILSDTGESKGIDFRDCFTGNLRDPGIDEVWNSPRAQRFRKDRREKPLSVRRRRGSNYISEIRE